MNTIEENYRSFDFSKLLTGKQSPLRDVEQRADARLAGFSKLTVADRFAGFERIGYHPHGLYVPADGEMRAYLRHRVAEIGDVLDPEERIRDYLKLQEWSAEQQKRGVAGKWTGQQGLHRSTARFRLAAWGRRGGKTLAASREAMAVAIMKARAVIWVCAPTMKLVARCFDMILTLAKDLGLEILQKHDTTQEKLLVIGNGSRFEGVSLEEGATAAGAGVDFLLVDEAARVDDEKVWSRELLPVITDKNGDALLISSWEGDDNFFFELAENGGEDGDQDWEIFKGATWENFFQFPQGQKSTKIVVMQSKMDPLDFLEEYGGIPKRSRERVYSEFKEKVHIGHWPYNSKHPVRLATDPSSGGDPYAVGVFQDYGDYIIQIDEFYASGMACEQISPLLKERPWFENVTDDVIDNNWPMEIVRWGSMGWPAFPVPEKPEIRERVPILRRWLKDPVRWFNNVYLPKARLVMIDMGLPDGMDYQELDPDQKQAVAIQVEEMLADPNLTAADIEALKGTAKIRIDRRCVNTVKEFKKYKYKKGTELFAKGYDHIMDAWGYYIWTFHRTDDQAQERPGQMSYFRPPVEIPEDDELPEAVGQAAPVRQAGQGFLGHARDRYGPKSVGDTRYLRRIK